MQASVFRAVENKRSLIRCSNTGISAFVDPSGNIKSYLKDNSGKKTYISGHLVDVAVFNDTVTFYSLFGDVFAYICIFYFLLELTFVFVKRKTAKVTAV